MALWDHGADDRANSAGSRSSAAKPAQVDAPIPAFLRRNVSLPRYGNDNSHFPFEDGPALELDCLRRVLAPQLLRAAELRRRELGIGADQVLIHWGVIDEAAYLRRLSFHTGVGIANFSGVDRGDSPLTDSQLPFAATFGIIPLRQDGRLTWTLAPRRYAARTLCRLSEEYPSVIPNMRLSASSSLQQFMTQQGNRALAHGATHGLSEKFPKMSAAPVTERGALWWHRLRRGCGVAALAVMPPVLIGATWSDVLAVWFLLFIGLRLTGSLWRRESLPNLARLSDARLPVYTIIAALYREASSVAPLIQAINALDYPPEKLDVILVIEPDDLQTRAAIARLGTMPHVQILIAPDVAPKTKPKALNYALPFARGSFVAVFDAEDRPEPNQLRAALDAFRIHGDDVACAQAALCIDNTTNSWLSRGIMAQTPQDNFEAALTLAA